MTTPQQRIGRSTAAWAVVLLACSSLLAGCSTESSVNTAPTAPSAPSPDATVGGPDTPTSSSEEAEVSDVNALVRELKLTLESTAQTNGITTSAQLSSAFEAAGIDPAVIESSRDSTPTGLDVDALEAAASVQGTCVVAQIRENDVTVTTLPVLKSGLCFIGDER